MLIPVLLVSFCLPFAVKAQNLPLGPLGCGDVGCGTGCSTCQSHLHMPRMPRPRLPRPRLFNQCGVCQQPQCCCPAPAPVIRQRIVPRQRLTYEMVPQTIMRRQAIACQVPVTTYRNVTVDEGCWKRVWVPRYVTKSIPQTVMTQSIRYQAVPQTVMTRVPRVTTDYAVTSDCQYGGLCSPQIRNGQVRRYYRQDLRYQRRLLRRPYGYTSPYGYSPYGITGMGYGGCPDGLCGTTTIAPGTTLQTPTPAAPDSSLSVPQVDPVLPYSVPGSGTEPQVPTPMDQTTWVPVPARYPQTAIAPRNDGFRIPQAASAASQYRAF